MDINTLVAGIKQNRKYMMVFICMLSVFACIAGYIISKNSGEIVIYPSNQIEQVGRENDSSSNNKSDVNSLHDKQDKNDNTVSNLTKIEAEKDKIKVYVAGCVNSPGVYIIEKGSILLDAIVAAGGLTEEADAENINMVYELKENVMIKILSKKDTFTQQSTPNQQMQNKTPSKVIIGKTEGSAVIADAPSYTNQRKNDKDSRININTASQEELERLPGIGPAKARDIIEYRDKNGKFKAISDIMKIPGIKQSRYNTIKDLICVDQQ